ncbi:hypothetical protein HPB47_028311 [Ixodes persulcatus]|uniref:Uncharacterized protein n=1 Tax=Ixodes persulcatus TaxID=34615 RepID=A0AC60PTL8_IXOPE|nr:hypothetical protein HPB47_028311 [Ixodes persulcatus]
MNTESTDQLMLAALQDIADSGTSFKDGYEILPKESTTDAMTYTSSTIVSACDDDDMRPDDDEFETAQGKKRCKTDPRCHASSLRDEGNLHVVCTVLYIPTENHKVESLSKLKLTDYLNNVGPGMEQLEASLEKNFAAGSFIAPDEYENTRPRWNRSCERRLSARAASCAPRVPSTTPASRVFPELGADDRHIPQLRSV